MILSTRGPDGCRCEKEFGVAAHWSAARWAMRILGTVALIGAAVVMLYPVAVPAGPLATSMLSCGTAVSIDTAGAGERACVSAIADQRTLALALTAIGILTLLSCARLVLSPATRAPQGEPGRPDWVTA
jgi:hypothetical protein